MVCVLRCYSIAHTFIQAQKRTQTQRNDNIKKTLPNSIGKKEKKQNGKLHKLNSSFDFSTYYISQCTAHRICQPIVFMRIGICQNID